MTVIPPFLQESSNGVLLRLKVQPRSKKNEIAGVQGEELRIKVTAPPVDSAANRELIRFLANTLKCPKSTVSITRGQASRHKVVLLQGIPLNLAIEKLDPYL